MPKRMIFLLALSPAFSGCSPYVYRTETAGFSAGVDQLEAAQEAAMAGLAADREASLRYFAIAARTPVVPSPDCIEPTPDGVGLCSMVGLSRGTLPAEIREQVEVEQAAAPALQWLTALARYAAALAAITDATDRAALVADQEKLAAAVQALARQHDEALVARAKAGDAGAKATPLLGDAAAASVGAIASAADAALDRQRLQALKAAVDQADGPVQVLAALIGDDQAAIQAKRRASLAQYATEVTERLGPVSTPASYARRLDIAIAATQQINAIAAADPRQAALKMAQAHHALREAIDAGKGQDLQAIELLTEFVAAAGAVRDGFKETAGSALADSGTK